MVNCLGMDKSDGKSSFRHLQLARTAFSWPVNLERFNLLPYFYYFYLTTLKLLISYSFPYFRELMIQ